MITPISLALNRSDPNSMPYIAYSPRVYGDDYAVAVDHFDGKKGTGSMEKPHVVKFDYKNNQWENVGSFISPHPGEFAMALDLSIAVSPSGIPYILFRGYDYAYHDTFVMKLNNQQTQWISVANTDVAAGNLQYESLIIDSNGNPYLNYQNGLTGAAMVKTLSK